MEPKTAAGRELMDWFVTTNQFPDRFIETHRKAVAADILAIEDEARIAALNEAGQAAAGSGGGRTLPEWQQHPVAGTRRHQRAEGKEVSVEDAATVSRETPPVPYMADIVAAAWARVGRPSLLGYDFICHCGVCSALRSKTKDPREVAK